MNRTFTNQMFNDRADRPPSDGESSCLREESAVGTECGSAPHPGLEAERRSTLLDLAYEQYCQRIERGEHIDIADFCREFPELGSALHRQLMVHDLIDDRMSLWLSCCDAVLPRAGERFLGFQLVEEIGRGAFARVFRATDGELGEREVAVKVCPAGSHEAWIMGRLKHANVVPIYSVRHDAESGLSAICMPYLGRVTLRDLMVSLKKPQTAVRADAAPGRGSGPTAESESRRRKLWPFSRSRSTVDSALFVGHVLAEALAYAHGQGVLHLDLKPSNVLVDDEGCLRLLDFNLASDNRREMPQVGGTLAYMAPEQARCFLDGGDGARLDGRCDVFALGAILYEMLCGSLPYADLSAKLSSRQAVAELVERQVRGDSELWAGVSVDSSVRRIVQRCLQVDPNDRYPSAAALAHDLKREASAKRRTLRWMRCHRRVVTSGVGALAVLVSSLAVGLAHRDPYPVRQFEKGLACLATKQHAEAVACLTRSINAGAQQPEVLFARARALVALERYHEAIADLKAAGEGGQSLALLAYCCNQVSAHAEAMDLYDRCLQCGYCTEGVYNNLGFSCYLRGRYEGALEALDSAVALGNRLSTTLYNRAVVHHAMAMKARREPVEAMRDIDRLVSLGVRSAQSYYRAAVIYAHASRYDASWKSAAQRYVDLAMEHGIPAASMRAHPLLSSFMNEDHPGPRPLGETRGAEDFDVTSHFLIPLD